MPYVEFPEHQPNVDWTDIQNNLSPDIGLDDVPGFTKEAGNAGRESILIEQDSLYANSGLLNEKLEIERHLNRMIDEEKLPYITMERSLLSMGYRHNEIRAGFQRITGINPVHAYLDMDLYPSPPGAISRYNYGWGESKTASADFFFILPWIDSYAIYKQTGLEREIVEKFNMVDDARQALKKHVKSFHDVGPEVADTLTDLVGRLSNISQLSKVASKVHNDIADLMGKDANIAAKSLEQALEEGTITPQEFKVIAENVVLGAPQDASQTFAPSAPERVDEKEFNKFRDEQEGKSFKEMYNNITIPGQGLASEWADQNKVDFWGTLIESREMFNQIVSTIDGYTIEPSKGSFDIMNQPNVMVDEENHTQDGSVVVSADAKKLGTDDESKIAIMFFIHNGKLKFSGKFKGSATEREYALTTQGLDDYFSDLEGKSELQDEIGKGTGAMSSQEARSPFQTL